MKRATTLGLAVAVAACAGEKPKPPASSIVVRDSAGIRIVEHPAGYEETLPVWAVDGTPEVDIGAGEGPGHDLDQVRGAVRLSGGRIVVLNGGTRELRFFDSTGKYLFAAGRQGHGPGEFAAIGAMQLLPGDTIFMVDPQLRRGSLFAASGDFVRSATVGVRGGKGYVMAMALLSDGRLLAIEQTFAESRETSGPVRRDPFAIVALGWDSMRADTLVVVPGSETYPTISYEGGRGYPNKALLVFGRQTAYVTDGERVYVGTNEPGGVQVYDSKGKLLRAMRNATPPEPVTEEHRKRRAEERLASTSRLRASEQIKADWRKNDANVRYAEVFPQYERLLVGSDRSLWVERPRRYEDEGRRYVVYDSTGRAIATVKCPERVRPYVVGPERIIGLWRDPDEVHHVRVYRVSR